METKVSNTGYMWESGLEREYDWDYETKILSTTSDRLERISINFTGIFDPQLHPKNTRIKITSETTGKSYIFEYTNSVGLLYYSYSPIDSTCPVKEMRVYL